MRIRLAVPDAHVTPAILNAALEAVTKTDEGLIASGMVPTFDEALRKGVKWHPEKPGDEHFDPANLVVGRGHGDCDDLSPYAAATHRLLGTDPGARAVVIPSRVPGNWHAVVQHSDGSYSDPSADAGMHEWRQPVQPRMRGPRSLPHVSYSQVNGGAVARCDLPWRGTGLAISGHGCGETTGEAVADAISGACLVGGPIAHPDHVCRLQCIEALLRGADPHELAAVLHSHGRGHIVGSLFGSLLRTAAHLAPIPGVAQAYDVAEGAAKMFGGKHGGHAAAAAAPSAASATAPFPSNAHHDHAAHPAHHYPPHPPAGPQPIVNIVRF